MAVRNDIHTLQSNVQVVVGTPGRVFDMINRRVLRLQDLRIFALDGADKMLEIGFKDQVVDVFNCLPENVQCCSFSRTEMQEVLDLMNFHMRDPVSVDVVEKRPLESSVRQFYIDVADGGRTLAELKTDALCDLYQTIPADSQAIICKASPLIMIPDLRPHLACHPAAKALNIPLSQMTPSVPGRLRYKPAGGIAHGAHDSKGPHGLLHAR